MDLFKQNAILRCRGRIQASELPQDAISSVYLPPNAFLTTLIILHEHRESLHSSTTYLLRILRQRFWIPQGRRTIAKALKTSIIKCTICLKEKVKPYDYPNPPPLATLRVRRMRPFTAIGLDYYGPIRVKAENNKFKAYGLIFTCLATRAVHLETTYDMTSQEFIRAFRKFAARRGIPKFVYSDNGSQIVASLKTIDATWHSVPVDKPLMSYAATKGITWRLNPPRSPWWGGYYERLVALVKAPLRRIIGRKVIDFNELSTLTCEVEAILNNRPLSYQGNDENVVILTPQRLLIPYETVDTTFPSTHQDLDPEDHEFLQGKDTLTQKLTRELELSNKTLEYFWTEWRESYLTSLRERHKKTAGQDTSGVYPKCGDVVIIAEDDVPRNFWRIGRIIAVSEGSDKNIRTATVRSQGKKLIRSVNQLYPLESNTDLPKEKSQGKNPEEINGTRHNLHNMRLRNRAQIKLPKKLLFDQIHLAICESMPARIIPRILTDVEDDGNCLYRAASVAIFGVEDLHVALRRLQYDYTHVQCNGRDPGELEYIARMIPGPGWSRKATLTMQREYLSGNLLGHASKMLKDKVWAEVYDLMILARATGRTVANVYPMNNPEQDYRAKVIKPDDTAEAYARRESVPVGSMDPLDF